MKHSFSILLTLCILMIIGMALIPGLDIADQPRPRQGSRLSISYSWSGASAKVVEQNVTSRIEGMVSAVNGVESVSSVSNFGSGHVTVQLKKGASVSGAKFEIASLMRQVRDRLPEGVSWPVVSGGDVVSSSNAPERNKPLLTWQINADMPDREIRKRTEELVKPKIERIKGVKKVDVSGGTDFYLEISYDAVQLAHNQLTAGNIAETIRNFLGRDNIIGDVMTPDADGSMSRTTMLLTIDPDKVQLESLPIKNVDGKIVYLNNLAHCTWKESVPSSYYRVNGMNTVYLNVWPDDDVNLNLLANEVHSTVDEWTAQQDTSAMKHPMHFSCVYDRAEEQFSAFRTTMERSGLSLLILLLFVWLSRRNMRYLLIITTALLANLLIAVIAYRLADIRLHPTSMAGMAVSLGLIIDATIVMVDHYSYHHNRSAFAGIMGAMLTTIGSLIIIFWLPEDMRLQLYDFSWIVIINLSIALVVAFFFVPALTHQMHYDSRSQSRPQRLRLLLGWQHFFERYMRVATHRIWRWVLLLVMTGAFVWSLMLFCEAVLSNHYQPEKGEMTLNIRGQMPIGGTAAQLNEKVREVEAFLTQYSEIKRFETRISGRGAYITVSFKPEALQTGFPYYLEAHTIGKLISIGGTDWSTYGVNPQGFSNALNLQHRSERISIAGYDYDKLYRYAEEIATWLKHRGRITDIAIEIPNNYEHEDEFYMVYDHEKMAMDSLRPVEIHNVLSSLLYHYDMGRMRAKGRSGHIVLTPQQSDSLDLWQLHNSFISVSGRNVRVSDFMDIEQRKAKNSIPRENQEYRLDVAYNVLGSWSYATKVRDEITKVFTERFPIGFRVLEWHYGWRQDEETQYWLLGLVVIIIFFVGAILFESLYQALVIILLIPFSLIGMFLTYYFTDTEFGPGGFAATVLLCGLTVNAGIYLLNEYNHMRRQTPKVANLRHFMRAWNHKIIPIMLTVFSTVCGLIPFLTDGASERFWYPFAVGSISGLLFSLLILPIIFPLLIRKRKKVIDEE